MIYRTPGKTGPVSGTHDITPTKMGIGPNELSSDTPVIQMPGGTFGSGEYTLLVGCPTYGKPGPEFTMDSGWDLMFRIGRSHPEIREVYLERDVRTYRQMARHGIIEAALELGVTHLLTLDDDHNFTGKHFSKLWNAFHTDPKKPRALSALYFTRSLSCAPCIFNITNEGTVPIFYYPPDTVMPVPVVGFGFLLLDMQIFRDLNPPWFNLGGDFGEDAALCTRMLHAGYPVHVHTGVIIGHVLESPTIVDEAHYLRVREGLENARAEAEQAGVEMDLSKLAPAYPGAQDRTGYAPVGPGDRRAAVPWWHAPSARVWNRDREDPASPNAKREGSDDLAARGATREEPKQAADASA